MPLKSLYDGPGYLSTAFSEVKSLVDSHQESLRQADEFGMIPLHYASLYGAPLKVVKYLIKHYKGSIEAKTNNGSLPIHLVVMDNNHHHLIPYYLSLVPESAQARNNDNLRPCDIARAKKLRDTLVDNTNEDDIDEVVQLLENPQRTVTDYQNGKFWVYEDNGINSLYENSYTSDERWENTSVGLIKHLIKMNPAYVRRQQRENGYLPLHYACFYKTKLAVVKLLVNANPEGLNVKSKAGWLPLHLAAMQNQHHLLDYLMEQYPESISEEDNKGKTALDYATRYTRNESVAILSMAAAIRKLRRRQYSDVEKRLMKGVHSLYSTSQSLWGTTTIEHLEALVNLNPHLLTTPDNDYGRLPIHFAVEYGAPSDLCAQLIHRNSKALQLQDKYGLLPIHLCATWNRFELLPYFVTCYPNSVNVKDGQGCTPLDYAQLYDRKESIALLSNVSSMMSRYTQKHS